MVQFFEIKSVEVSVLEVYTFAPRAWFGLSL